MFEKWKLEFLTRHAHTFTWEFSVSCSQICLESFDLNSLDSTDEPPMKKMKAEAMEEDTSIYTNPIEKDNEEVCVYNNFHIQNTG